MEINDRETLYGATINVIIGYSFGLIYQYRVSFCSLGTLSSANCLYGNIWIPKWRNTQQKRSLALVLYIVINISSFFRRIPGRSSSAADLIMDYITEWQRIRGCDDGRGWLWDSGVVGGRFSRNFKGVELTWRREKFTVLTVPTSSHTRLPQECRSSSMFLLFFS